MRTALFLVLFGFFAGPSLAQGWHRHEGVQTLDRLLPQIRRSHPGKFYDAEGPTRGPDGQMHYHLKWLTPDGRLIWLDTDARTGRVLGVMGVRSEPNYYRGPTPYPGGWPYDSRAHYDHDRSSDEQGYGGHGQGRHDDNRHHGR